MTFGRAMTLNDQKWPCKVNKGPRGPFLIIQSKYMGHAFFSKVTFLSHRNEKIFVLKEFSFSFFSDLEYDKKYIAQKKI